MRQPLYSLVSTPEIRDFVRIKQGMAAEMLEMTEQKYATIKVQIIDREDGGVRVFSDDLPGLILSGEDNEVVVAAIVPAIEAILTHMGFEGFSVHPSRKLAEIVDGDNPQDFDVHVKQFVVEWAKAA